MIVVREFQPRLRLLRHRTHREVQVEQSVEGPRIVLVLYERRPQSILNGLALPEPRVLQGVEGVDALCWRDPQVMVSQYSNEVVDYSVHARPWTLVGVLVDGAVHLVHAL